MTCALTPLLASATAAEPSTTLRIVGLRLHHNVSHRALLGADTAAFAVVQVGGVLLLLEGEHRGIRADYLAQPTAGALLLEEDRPDAPPASGLVGEAARGVPYHAHSNLHR